MKILEFCDDLKRYNSKNIAYNFIATNYSYMTKRELKDVIVALLFHGGSIDEIVKYLESIYS